MTESTIAAVSTAPGEGAVGIVRLSGSASRDIAVELCGLTPEPRHAHFATFRDASGAAIDQGLLLFFPGPRSFTGEDTVELQGHGGPVVLQMILDRVVELGATLARPGEFSERAFLNGKMDLAQAEAVADLIASQNTTAARAAARSLEGAFSKRCETVLEGLIALRVYVEAAIDFPDEEGVEFLADDRVIERLAAVRQETDELLQAAHRGRLVRTGLHVALTGRPNAGKSSLLNALSEVDAAIVTPIPGTTRDVLRERVQIHGVAMHLVDTAGIREASDVVEAEGVRRARREVELADIILHVVDAHADAAMDSIQADPRLIVVRNKADLRDEQPKRSCWHDHPCVTLSAMTGDGLDLLREAIIQHAGLADANEAPFTARARHLEALNRTQAHLDAAADQLTVGAGELVAEELRLAQDALGEITGKFEADALLGEIFSSFCIGK